MMLKRSMMRAVTTVAAAFVLVFAMQGQAMAAVKIPVLGGYGLWQADPVGDVPGDAIRACDNDADGLGITVLLYAPGGYSRRVSTRGHASPYCTPWGEGSGNLREGTQVDVVVLTVKGNRIFDQVKRTFYA